MKLARPLEIWRSWSVRTRVLVIGGLVAVIAGGAVAAYLALKREPDQVCPPPCSLEVERPPKKAERVETVNWPLYGYDDQRTRYLPTRRVRPPFDASEWSFQAGKLLEFSPIVAKGTLYFQDKDALLYALSADRGKVEWKKQIGALGAASPAYSQGLLYAVTLQRAPGVDQGEVLALRARDGKLLWRRQLPGRSETSPIVVGGNVIVGSESGDVFAFNRRNGKVDWQVSTAGEVKGGLALDDGVLYGANYAGQVFALRASSGAYVWQSSTQGSSFGRGGPVYSTPAVAFGRVYLGSIDGRVYSFDQDTGDLAWSHSTGDWVYAAPAVAETRRAGPTVYVGSKDQNFYALDAKTGAVRWQKDLGGIVLGAASVLGETVYVAGLGPNIGTFGFDVKTGKKVFESELGEYNPVISDGNRMYLTGSSNIRAFEHETKAERKRAAERRRKERAALAARHKRQREAKADKRKRQREVRSAKLERQRQAAAAKRKRQRAARAAKLERQRSAHRRRRQHGGTDGGGRGGGSERGG
ncbi:MAG: PQQ-binding-like beta-propeller repeat protein [Solirubrobacterales bacterium]|nr:PQQ-binding-like beta-propeller repeat protein [Solirubrobacterales bacterium]